MQNVGSSDIYDSDIIDVMWWTDSGCVCVGGGIDGEQKIKKKIGKGKGVREAEERKEEFRKQK